MVLRIAILLALCAPAAAEHSKEAIEAVMRDNAARIRACYARELARDKELHGKVVVKFTIDGTGAVTLASLATSTIKNANVENCVVHEVRKLKFAATGKVAHVSYPFLFGPDR